MNITGEVTAMNETITALEQAIQLLKKIQIAEYSQISGTGLTKLFHAGYALEAQLKAMVSE